MDRYALAREFEFVRQCDAVQNTDNIEELRAMAIELLRLNRGLREMYAVMAKAEIPDHKP